MAGNTSNSDLRPDYRIDLDAVIDSSKGGEKLPRFVRNFIKRFIHLDTINDYLAQGKEGVEFCKGAMEYLDISAEVIGKENFDLIPKGKHCTIVSNHPLGGIDGIVTIAMLNERFGTRIRLLANSFLMELKGLAPVCIPINKMGGQNRSLPQAIRAAYDSENEMLVFPAGACSRFIRGRIQDYAWGKSFVKESIRSDRYIVPIHFIARNSIRFYVIDSICRAVHLKLNAGMFMLPSEMVRGRHKKVRLVIGKPIAPQELDSSANAATIAQQIRQLVYNL